MDFVWEEEDREFRDELRGFIFTLRGEDRSLAWGSPDECLADIARPTEWLP